MVEAPAEVHAAMKRPLLRHMGKRASDDYFNGAGLSVYDPVEKLQLPTKVTLSLTKNGISTIGDITLFTEDEYMPFKGEKGKDGIGEKSMGRIIERIDSIGLSFGDDRTESNASRLTRVYGSVKVAPATSLVPLTKLPVVSRYAERPITYGSFRMFIAAAEARTIGDLAELRQDEVARRAVVSGFRLIEAAAHVLRQQLDSVGL